MLFTHGMARGVRSLDAGIVCYIEPVLNPVWVFLVLGERPSAWALLGGAIIIVAVISHMLLDARGRGEPTIPPSQPHRANRQKRCLPLTQVRGAQKISVDPYSRGLHSDRIDRPSTAELRSSLRPIYQP